MRSWEEKINGETEEKKMNRQADFTDGSSSFDDGFDKIYEKIKTMKGASTVTYTNKGRKKGTTYKYKVRAYKTSGTKNTYGSFSAVTKIKVK